MDEEMLRLSGGNKYLEKKNPNTSYMIRRLQGNIYKSQSDRESVKEKSQRIFDLMKKEKVAYIQTLVKGEDEGHCKGIKKRIDPTTKYRLKQQMEKYQQIQEERMEQIKAMKDQKDAEKLR